MARGYSDGGGRSKVWDDYFQAKRLVDISTKKRRIATTSL